MDDVLASIRRIVIEEERAEGKRPPAGAEAAAPTGEDEDGEPIPLPTAFRRPGDEGPARAAEPTGPAVAQESGEEFVLTSSMQAQPEGEEAPEPAGEPAAGAPPAPEPAEPEPAPPADPAAAAEDAPVTLDEEELAEMVRGIIRKELTGSFGATLSKNIQKLVQEEVRKALASR